MRPSLKHRLSLVATAPRSNSAFTIVDLPTPPGPAISTDRPWSAPTLHTDACSGARPRCCPHHRAGYCKRTARMSKRALDRRTTDAARPAGGGRHLARISRDGCLVVISRSRPEEQASRTTTWPGRRQASLVRISHPRVSNAATLSSTVTRMSGREASACVEWPPTPSSNTPDKNRCRQLSSICSPADLNTARIRTRRGRGSRAPIGARRHWQAPASTPASDPRVGCGRLLPHPWPRRNTASPTGQ